VYLASPVAPFLPQRELAAQLALGPRAVLSHRTAARHLGIAIEKFEGVEITIDANRVVRPLDGVEVFRSRHLTRGDVIWRPPFLFTGVGRTVLDRSSALDRAGLAAMMEAAIRVMRASWGAFLYTLDQQGRGKPGAALLREVINEKRVQATVAASVMESFAMELGLATGRRPVMHHRVFQGDRRIAEIDLAWPDVQLAAEFDGWLFHNSYRAFVGDRRRDRALRKLGWRTERFTWSDVTEPPDATIACLMDAHAAQLAAVATAAPVL
jgi:hypothetical protein